MVELTFNSVLEPELGEKWQNLFRQAWPGWRAWYVAHGGDRGPSLAECEQALQRHMPELVPIWRRQVALAGNDVLAARFLSFWCPPAYLLHCSQAVLTDHDGPLLVRNYDLDPKLSEATVLCSAWTGRRVIATMEAIAGAADGVNAAGLAVSLTFGGRRTVGPGFGIPLIMRYVLEVCDTTADAVAVLRRVPSHMSYNVTVVDRAGQFATVFLAPDRPVEVTQRRYTTNHQRRVEWPEQARFSRTVERADLLKELLAGKGLTPAALTAAFLRPPLFSRNYAAGFGTVYTAAYRPGEASLTLHWPGMTPWKLSCADFEEGRRTVTYATGAPRPELPPVFAAMLAECLKRPITADWARLGQYWAGTSSVPALRLN